MSHEPLNTKQIRELITRAMTAAHVLHIEVNGDVAAAVEQRVNAVCEALERQTAHLAASEAEVATLRRERAEHLAIIEAIEAALEGQPVSDFLLSFPPVRHAVDLQAEVASLRQALSEKADEWRRQSDALTSWPREHALMKCANELDDVLAAVPAPAAPQALPVDSDGENAESRHFAGLYTHNQGGHTDLNPKDCEHPDCSAAFAAPAAPPITDVDETCASCGHSRRLHHFDKVCANGRGANWRQADAPVCECQVYVAAPPRPMLYFAQRQHPTDYGMVQVSAFKNEAERDELLITWKAENPGLHPYGWEHEAKQDIAAPAAPQEPT